MNRLSRWIFTISVILLFVVPAHGQTTPGTEVAMPKDWSVIKHSRYPVSVSLPPGWEAVEARAEIYPSDTWNLSPKGADPMDPKAPRIYFLLGWKPRLGRQSAFFPGVRGMDEKPVSWEIAGRKERCVFDSGKYFKCDFDRGPTVISVSANVPEENYLDQLRLILAGMDIDESPRVPAEVQERLKAESLARQYAEKAGYRGLNIVMLPEVSKDGVYSITIFYQGSSKDPKPGLIHVEVIPEKDIVKDVPIE